MDSETFLTRDHERFPLSEKGRPDKQEFREEEDEDGSEVKIRSTRDTWGGQYEFLLSLIGYTVGLGNLWRFPYICYRNGGGAFLIPYFLFMLVCGAPLFYMEVNFAQFSGKSVVNVWHICPLFKGLGLVMVCASTIVIWYQSMVFGWIWYYFIQSFYPKLGWASCDNEWNTPRCQEGKPEVNFGNGTGTGNYTVISVNSTGKQFWTPGEEFFQYNVLHKSSGIEELGHLQWHLLGCLALAWVVTFGCLAKGIKTLGKVVYVTATAPYVLLTILLIRGVTLDGAADGIYLYLYPDFSKLAGVKIWIEAAVQVFYSIGPAWGGIITMASFNKFHHNALRDSVIVCCINTFTALYGGLVVFSVLGFLAKMTGQPLSNLQFSGPSLAFIAYPEALSRLPLPQLWSALFFLTLIFIAIDTQFGSFETVTNMIVDFSHKKLEKYRLYISAIFAAVLFLTEIPLTFSGGFYIFVLTDWYIATFNITVTACLECVVISWIYGANRFSKDIEMIRGSRPSFLLRLAWCLIIPLCMMAIILMTVIKHTAPGRKGDYLYPEYALVIGNVIAFGPLFLIVIAAAVTMVSQNGSVYERLKMALRPSSQWKPNDYKQEEIYRQSPYLYETSFIGRFKTDIFGMDPK